MDPNQMQMELPIVPMIIAVIVSLITLAGMWKMYEKADKPGWACLIPIYNMIVLLDIAGKPAWWFLLFFIPIVNIIVLVLLAVGIAKSFGKGGGFAVGLLLLGGLFYPILGFGDAKYIGPQG